MVCFGTDTRQSGGELLYQRYRVTAMVTAICLELKSKTIDPIRLNVRPANTTQCIGFQRWGFTMILTLILPKKKKMDR